MPSSVSPTPLLLLGALQEVGTPRGLSVAELSPLLPTESGDVKAAIAVLDFILSNAAKHNVDGESLSSELQQLGLPKGGAWGGDTGGPAAAHLHQVLPRRAQSYSEQCTMLAVLSYVHAGCPQGDPWLSEPCPVPSPLGFGCPRAGAGSSGCSLLLPSSFSGRTRHGVVPLLRGEAELPAGQPQGWQPPM